MKKITLKLAAFGLMMTVFVSIADAQADRINVVTTAVPFLRISPDSRSGGMGDVGIATSPDANSSFWNLAKTPFNTTQGGIGVSYTPWLKDLGLNDVYLASLAGFYKVDDQQAISGSLRYFSLGTIQFTDNQGSELNSFRPREFAFDAGYSRKLSTKDAMGIALRYINSSLASGTINGVNYKPGSAVSADLHYFHTGLAESGEGLNWGATLSNLGTKISITCDIVIIKSAY